MKKYLNMRKQIKILFNAFWNRFFTDEPINITFFKDIFSDLAETVLITDNLEEVNNVDIIVNSLCGPTVKRDNAINILFAGEPYYEKDGWDIVLSGLDETVYKQAINTPLFISYMYCNNLLDKCSNRPKRTTIPSKFCCFITSNDKCVERNNLFFLINSYKKVDSVGQAFNTVGYYLIPSWGSPEFFEFISQYKFVICAENANTDNYISEKIFHGYIPNIVPIYWGSEYAKTIFNPKSYISLEESSEQSYINLLQKVVELDNNDSKWLDMVNEPFLINNKLPEDIQIQSIREKVADRISKLIINKTQIQDISHGC